jgi:outer membrane receptor protein involved in Fe transport
MPFAPTPAPAISHAAAASAVVSYPPEFFAASGAANAMDMLKRVPGFVFDAGGGARGFEASAGNVLVDGSRPANKSDALDEILRRIPASSVARIDVIRGGAPGIDMQGKAVVANIVRRRIDNAQATLTASDTFLEDGRRLGVARIDATGVRGGHDWLFSLRAAREGDDSAGSGRDTLSVGSATTQITDIRNRSDEFQYTAAGVYQLALLGWSGRVNAHASAFKLNTLEARTVVAPAPDDETFAVRRHTRDVELGADMGRAWGGKGHVDLVALFHTTWQDPRSTLQASAGEQVFSQSRRTTESILRGAYSRKTTAFDLEIGTEVALNDQPSRTRFVVNGAPVFVPAADVDVREARLESFGKGAWRRGALTAEAELRYERSALSSSGDVVLSKSFAFAKPRVLAAWTARSASQLRLHVERTVSQLNFDDFVATSSLNTQTGVSAGNPDLNPEDAWVFGAELEQRLPWGATALFGATHSTIADVIDRGPVFSPNGVFDRPANIGPGRRDALSVDLTVPLDRVVSRGSRFHGTFVRQWSAVVDPVTRVRREISASQPVQWTAEFDQDLTKPNATLGASIAGEVRKRYFRFNQIETVKHAAAVRFFAEWRMRPDFAVDIELQDILASRRRDVVETWSGVRNTGAPARVEDRALRGNRIVFVKVRKEFGG